MIRFFTTNSNYDILTYFKSFQMEFILFFVSWLKFYCLHFKVWLEIKERKEKPYLHSQIHTHTHNSTVQLSRCGEVNWGIWLEHTPSALKKSSNYCGKLLLIIIFSCEMSASFIFVSSHRLGCMFLERSKECVWYCSIVIFSLFFVSYWNWCFGWVE